MSWPTPQLQEFCRIIQGGRSGLSGNDFVPQGIPAYGAGGLNGYLPTHEFDEPAVILSSIGARCGKCFYAEGKWASLANTQLIFPDATKADVRFLWIQLNDESRWHRSGTGQPFIKPSDVKAHRVLLPPLAEQRRIAEVLDRAEALRAKRRAALAQLDSLTQSLFLDLFGDPATNPKGWDVARLGGVASTTSGGTPKRDVGAYFGGAIPWVKSGELHQAIVTGTEEFLTERGLAESSAKLIETGAVLVAMYGATVGAVALLGIRAATNQAICCITVSPKLGAPFLVSLLKWLTPSLLAKRVGGAQPNLSQDLLRNLVIPVPPIALQREFARRVTAVEALKTAQRASLAELDALFATLQHRAFRGEL